jgi:hypothetical protein
MQVLVVSSLLSYGWIRPNRRCERTTTKIAAVERPLRLGKAMPESAARSGGSSPGRQLVRGVLGSLKK